MKWENREPGDTGEGVFLVAAFNSKCISATARSFFGEFFFFFVFPEADMRSCMTLLTVHTSRMGGALRQVATWLDGLEGL